MHAVLICQPHAASTCWITSSVPNPTRCLTRTRRRRRTVLTPCAYSSAGRGIHLGFGGGPVAWRRGGGTQSPKLVSNAVAYSFRPSVRNKGTPPDAHTCPT